MDIVGAMGSALYSALGGNTSLVTKLGGTAVYFTSAPQGTSLPFVLYGLSGGGDLNDTPKRALDLLANVSAIGTSMKQASEIDALVDEVLHFGTLTVNGLGNYWTARESCFAFSQDVGGRIEFHVGGTYRIRLSK